MGQFVGQYGLLLIQRNPVEHGDDFAIVVIVRGDLLTFRLHQEPAQVELPGQQAELLHGDFRTCKPLVVFFAGHLVTNELLHISLAN